ncbi:MAG: succinate dehydrogenase [Acidimicrobiaceae bacterium]|jgi:succinate dehydrogenase / fumarate reductase cytochrome b subunit|nr:succinate dehydrogenase [Acidimicrobiaceae bacterium]MDP6480964.1 succinate dehydrogenase cytochrome b subunit [Acidimicrobiales bacterium]|tara:strand:- start:4288 stop:5127 length:840 start_codon:yes stop_codon:yes gene_type:complete
MAQSTRERYRVDPVRTRRRTWPFPLDIYQSAVGRKWVMALTGIGLVGFALIHMVGNLHVYEGPARMYEYAETLRTLGGGLVPKSFVLWLMRLGLTGMFALHLHAAITLKDMSRHSSDDAGLISGAKKYAGGRDHIAASYASRTMRWTGPIIALYLLFHLADLTWGWWLGPDFVRGDPYHNVATSLSSLPVAILYVVANVALALHIFHGAWSIFQSLGVNNPRYNHLRRALAAGIAGLILIGNLSFPVLTQTGLISEDNRACPVNDSDGLACLAEEAEGH